MPQNRPRKAENPRLAAAMAGEDAAAATSAGAAGLKNPPKKGEEEDEDEEDNLPLSHSRGKKKASDANASKAKVEDDDDEDDIPLLHSRGKKASNGGASKAKVEDDNDQDDIPLSHSRGKKASNGGASKAKKEEDDEDDYRPLSHSRSKKGNEKQKSSVNSKAKASKVKKEETESDDDFKQKKIKKGVGIKEDEKKAAGDKVKKEKKVYELPGQKHDPPPERDPLRIFYESLYEQVPTSEMAATWLMEWGLLPLDVARKVYQKKQGQKLKSPVKTAHIKSNTSSPMKKAPLSSAKKINSAAKDAGKTTAQKKRRARSDTENFLISKTKTKRQKMISS